MWFDQFQDVTIQENEDFAAGPPLSNFDGRHQERTEPFCAAFGWFARRSTSCRLLFDLSYSMAAAKPPRGYQDCLNFPWLQGAATARQVSLTISSFPNSLDHLNFSQYPYRYSDQIFLRTKENYFKENKRSLRIAYWHLLLIFAVNHRCFAKLLQQKIHAGNGYALNNVAPLS